MTNEEAIKQLKKCKSFHNGSYGESLNMAIKSIEVLDKLESIIVDQLDKSTDQKESMTLRWVLDKMAEVEE